MALESFHVSDDVLLASSKSNKLASTFNLDSFTVVRSSPGKVTVQRGPRILHRRRPSAVKLMPKVNCLCAT